MPKLCAIAYEIYIAWTTFLGSTTTDHVITVVTSDFNSVFSYNSLRMVCATRQTTDSTIHWTSTESNILHHDFMRISHTQKKRKEKKNCGLLVCNRLCSYLGKKILPAVFVFQRRNPPEYKTDFNVRFLPLIGTSPPQLDCGVCKAWTSWYGNELTTKWRHDYIIIIRSHKLILFN